MNSSEKDVFLIRVSIGVVAILMLGAGGLVGLLTWEGREVPAFLTFFLGAALIMIKSLFQDQDRVQAKHTMDSKLETVQRQNATLINDVRSLRTNGKPESEAKNG